MLITVEKLKENFEKEGKTLASWARKTAISHAKFT